MGLNISRLWGIKCEKKLNWMSVYGPHKQIKCLFKALLFRAYKRNVLIYYQTRFHLYQSHNLTATGLKSGKNYIKRVSVGILETLS